MLAKVFSIYLPPQYPYMVVGGNQMVKQADFDDRIDVLPVSDPNIFSMAQRVTLAQQQLQLATAAPQLHNLREAYRRMYDAMGVDNVDAILKPDPEMPEPISPAMENAGAMRGQGPKAFPMQDHMAHIEAHAEFMFTRMVQINPQLYAMLQAHVSEHISLIAAQQVTEKFKPQFEQLQQQMQQAQQNPQAMQQLQQQQDQLVNQQAAEQAKVEAQMTKQLAQDEEARISREQQDPLVKLKQQEIDLKAMQTQMQMQKDMVMDSAKLDLERDKLEAETSIDLMKASADASKEDSAEAISVLKENMAATREAMKNEMAERKNQSAERIAKENARSRANGQSKKTTGKA